MLEQTGERRVEGSVACPETRKGEDALTTELLNQATLREDDAEDITKRGQSDKHGESALCGATKNIPKERSGYQATSCQDLFLRNGGKVGNVDKHVENRHDPDGQRGCNLERSDRIAGFAKGIVGVAVANIAPDDIVERSDNTICTPSSSFKGIGEVVRFLGKLDVAAKCNPARHHNDQHDDEFNYTEKVLESETPLESGAMDQEGSGDTSKADTSLVPSINFDIGGVKYVFAKHDRIASRPSEENHVSCVQACGEELGLPEDILEVVFLAAILRYCRAEFQVNCRPGSGN